MAKLRDLQISPRRTLPKSLLSVRFSRASGPGGQHVNRTASKADVRLDLEGASAYLGEHNVQRIRHQLAARLDAEGNLQVVCEEHREQGRNVELALARMEALLARALQRPKPRRPTKPTKGSQERRIQEKKRRGETKRQRKEY